jgi:tetratricopeptide (TPR) repeat protein
MLRPVPPPHSRAALRGLGVGLLLCGLVIEGGRVVGPSPRSVALILGAALAGLAVGGAIPGRRPRALAPMLGGGLGLGLAGAMDPGTRALALALESAGAAGVDLSLTISGGAFVAMLVIGWLARGLPAGRAVTIAGGAAGVALAAVCGPTLSLAVGAAAVALPAQRTARGAGGGAWLLLPVAAVGVASVAALQPGTSPAPAGLLAYALGATAAAALVSLLPVRPGQRVAVALGGLAAAATVPLLAPELSAELAPFILGARPSRGRILLLLPLMLGGGAAGAAAGGLLRSRGAAIAIALGLTFGALAVDVTAIAWIAAGTGALVALGTAPLAVRGAGAALVAAVLVADWQGLHPDPATLSSGVHRTVRSAEAWKRELDVRTGLVDVDVDLGAAGASVVRAPKAWAETTGQRGRPDSWAHHVEQQGTVSTSGGREAEAERLSGHLGGLFAPEDGAVLVLGDTAGRALGRLLNHPTGPIDVSTPTPASVRAVAALDPAARESWLSSRVRLRDTHPDALLRQSQDMGLVLEVVRTSWRDAVHAAPDEQHLDAVRAALGADGVYVLAVHLSRFDAGAPAALARAVAARFGHVQLWIPPSGADTLFMVAGPTAPSLARFEMRVPRALADLRGLGVPSAAVLAGFAIADGTSAGVWDPEGEPSPPLRLPDATLRKPLLHLASLAPHVATPASLWQLEGARQDAAQLAVRIAGRQTFLGLLGDAATGDLQGVFSAARELVEQEGPIATQALSALIEPQLTQARESLRIAVREGPSSRRWEDAQRSATTARMLSPRSPEPPLLLGEVALAQGNLNRSQEEFEAALGLDERSTAARTGLARVAIARRDYATAEEHLREAARLNPQDWQAWSNLGRHLTETGATEEAEEALRRAATLAGPDAPDPHLRLAELYLASDRPTTALVHAERAVVLGGGADAFYLRGRGYFDVNELDKAEDDFRRAVLADSRHTRARGAIGHIRAMKGDLQAAAENFRQVVAMDPSNAAARENLDRAEGLLRQQGFDGAGVVPPG